ncbi:MAG: hypothetical protein ABIH23_34215, partial [bacterium]
MSPAKENESHTQESCRPQACPVGALFDMIFNLPGERLDHFRQAKIEVLRGIRGLIDERIETLENVR